INLLSAFAGCARQAYNFPAQTTVLQMTTVQIILSLLSGGIVGLSLGPVGCPLAMAISDGSRLSCIA
ncbi:MAG: hypothetical protein WCA78_04085, partial [Rhizomicrobium sp.]